MNWHPLNSLRLLIPLLAGILGAELFGKSNLFFLVFLPVGIALLTRFHFKKTAFQTRWPFGLAAQILLFSIAWQRTKLIKLRARNRKRNTKKRQKKHVTLNQSNYPVISRAIEF